MLVATLQSSGWCPWCGEHMGWGGGWIMMLTWLLLLSIVIAGIWWLAQRGGGADRPPPVPDRAEAILRERFARGEIDEDTYHQQLAELRRP